MRCLIRPFTRVASVGWFVSLSVLALFSASASAQTPPAASASPALAGDKLKISIVLAREMRERPLPLSLLDLPPADDGLAGGKLGIADNNTTGRFLNQEFSLEVVEATKPDALIADVQAKVAAGMQFVIVDAAPTTILAMADALKDKSVLLLNASSTDDNLREEDCRANVMHTAPTRSMLTDALAQYLAWKKWREWFLVLGSQPEDKLFADALRRSAKRFGAKIVDERTFQYDPGSRRTDGGFEQIQQQIPTFTQGAKPHDVVVVADEGELFGEYLPFRTWDPRPVAGTAGLTAAPWHPSLELWGGTQFQNRFKRQSNRSMRTLDYNVWLAVRAVGEATSRQKTGDLKTLVAYMRSPAFELAAFKGVKTTFRDWNGQLRQPLIITTAKILVSVSPQAGFLHQLTELDTLGFDKPETKCKAYNPK